MTKPRIPLAPGESGEMGQVNLRMPVELIRDLRLLAEEDGVPITTLIVGLARTALDESLMTTGEEQFMADLDAEHATRKARYQARFDDLRTRDLL